MPNDKTSSQPRTADMLTAPWVPDALPLLPDEGAYKIPRLVQAGDLRVEVPELWPGADFLDPGERTKVTWLWDDVVVGVPLMLEAPYDASDLANAAGTVPNIRLDVPGMHSLQYIVELVEGNPSAPSYPIQIDIDKIAPNQAQPGSALTFPQEIIDNGVTDNYLLTHGDRVVATIMPAWPDMRLEDVAEAYLTLLPSRRPTHPRSRLFDVVAQVKIEQDHLDGAPIELIFEGDTFRTLHSNREYSAQYRLTDRAGWEGPASRTFVLFNALTPSPVEFRAPEVPQAFGSGANGLIDLEDAREPGGVYMNILQVAGSDDGDVLRPSWNLIPLPEIIIGPFQVWPIRVPIAWPILAQGGFETAAGIVRASYTWRRGTGPIRPSEPRFVPVDLTVAGVVNPNNPDPLNLLLARPTVKGLTGDDILTLSDSNQPANVEWVLGAGFSPGDQLELIWNDNPIPVDIQTVSGADHEGGVILFQIAWEFISPLGNALVNLHVQTFNGVNRQRSDDKLITVAIAPIIGLKITQYPDVNYGPGPGAGFVGCALKPHPSHGVQVLVPGDEMRLEVGDVLRLRWAGYASANGNPSTLIDNSQGQWDSPPLTLEWVRDGFPFIVPFDPHVLRPGLVKPEDYPNRPPYGSATTTYTVLRSGVNIGTSNRSLVLVSLIRPGGEPPCIADGE